MPLASTPIVLLPLGLGLVAPPVEPTERAPTPIEPPTAETQSSAERQHEAEAGPGQASQPERVGANTSTPTIEPTDERSDPTSPLVPPGETISMSDHPVDFANARYVPGKGLAIASKDGDFAIITRLRAQFRYELENDNATDDLGQVFNIRRGRVQFKGNVWGEHNKYKLELAFSPRDLGFRDGNPTNTPILTWYTEFDYLRDFTVRVGQYKIPYSRQRVVSSGNLQLVDRSLANGEFTLDRDIGLDFRSKDVGGWGYLRYYAGLYTGEGRDMYQLDDFGMNYLGRIEVLPLGGADSKWDYSESDFDRLLRPRLSLAVSYAFVDEAKNTRGIRGGRFLDGGTADYHNVGADFVFEMAGFSTTGEFFYRDGTRDFGNATTTDDMGNEIPLPRVPARNGLGYMVQAGYLIPRLPLEFAARWGQVFGLGNGTETSLPDGDEVGGGLSWYFAEHPFKIQADYFRLRRDRYDPEARAFSYESWGNGEDRFRIQMQVAF